MPQSPLPAWFRIVLFQLLIGTAASAALAQTELGPLPARRLVDSETWRTHESSLRIQKNEEYMLDYERVDGDRLDVRREWNKTKQQLGVPNAHVARRLWDKTSFYTYVSAQPNSRRYLNISGDKQQVQFWRTWYPGDELDGYLRSDESSVSMLLRNVGHENVVVSREEYDKVVCRKTATRGKFGALSVWQDDQRDGVILKAVLIKSPDSNYFGSKLAEYNQSLTARQKKDLQAAGFPTAPIDSLIYELKVDEVRLVDGKWIPWKGQWSNSITHGDGSTELEVTTHRRIRVDFNPDFAKERAFELDFPDGTEVGIEGESNLIPKIWRAGKIVPVVDVLIKNSVEETVAQFGKGGDVMNKATTLSPPSNTGTGVATSTLMVPLVWVLSGISLFAGIGVALGIWRFRGASRRQH